MNIKNSRRYLLIALAVISLSSCALPGNIKTTERNVIRKIAVVSELGKTFKGSFTATTILGNKTFTADVSDWKVDTLLTETAIAQLKSAGRTAFALPVSEVKSDLQQQLQIAKTKGADTLLVVSPARYDNQADFPEGYGLHRRKIFNLDKTCVYSLFTVNVYNITTGKSIGWAWSFPISSGRIPCTENKSIVWKDDFNQFTVQEKQNLRHSTLTGVSTNLQVSLKQLGLTQ